MFRGSLLRRGLLRYWIRSLGRPAQELAAALPKLPEASRHLENRFLAIQDHLERLSAISASLVQSARDLVGKASGRETGSADFERTLAVLHSPLQFLSSAVEEIPLLAADLAAVRATVSETMTLESELERVLSPLKFMQTMFRVESATLPASSREIFMSLASEIGTLFRQVRDSLGEQFAGLAEIRSTLHSAGERMERSNHVHVRELARRRREMESTLDRMASEAKANARRNIQLTEASADFAKAVENAVMGLQTQDIVSQRLEHAAAGLRDAAAAVESAQHASGHAAIGNVQTLSRIELAQLDAVIGELESCGDKLRGAIGLVGGRIGNLDDECILLHEFQHITVSVDGIVQVLIDSLGTLRDMTFETLQLASQCQDMIRPAESALSRVTTSVDAIARKMGRIALNAQIRAVQIQSRTGLEVLASRTSEIANETLRISEQLGAGLTRTGATLNTAAARLRRLRNSAEEALTICDGDGKSEERMLHSFRDQTLHEVTRFGDLVHQARSLIDSTIASIDVSGAVELLCDVRDAVRNLSVAAERIALPAGVTEASAIERRYTMSGERVVHHRVLHELGAEGDPGAHSSAAESNVELF